MSVFDFLAQGFGFGVNVMSVPISYLGNISLLDIAKGMIIITLVSRFLLKPMFGRHPHSSAGESKNKSKSQPKEGSEE